LKSEVFAVLFAPSPFDTLEVAACVGGADGAGILVEANTSGDHVTPIKPHARVRVFAVDVNPGKCGDVDSHNSVVETRDWL
jgi:hypothetical protein